MIRRIFVLLISIWFFGCQSKPYTEYPSNPYPVGSWVKCRQDELGKVFVDFYIWNRSEQKLTVSLDQFVLLQNGSDEVLNPARKINYNYKSANGNQDFRDWNNRAPASVAYPEHKQAESALLALEANDATDIEFQVESRTPVPPDRRVRGVVTGTDQKTYQLVVPCK